ncbi:MAG TPA: protoheme IX farnesyltransferase, partial [Candidatus Saccharimonadales bacterium]|nr:protoheme IX farnesyltransferase [Candidatus Saccharimonadales bacterium]
MTAVAGFLFASRWHIDWLLFASLLIGVTFVIASACVMNNLLDRRLDKKMSRTRNRALPAGKVSPAAGLVFGLLLGAAGFWALSFTNALTMAIIAVGYIGYVVAYGWSKRHTVYSTLIGTVPGGASLVAGYTAVTGSLDRAAAILFVIMLAWQMVHFYAIAV